MKKKLVYFFVAVTLIYGCKSDKQKGLTYFNDFESIKGWTNVLLSADPVHSGKYSNKLDSNNLYGLTLSLPFRQITPLHIRKAKVTVWVYLTANASGYIAMDVKTKDKKTIFWAGEALEKKVQPGIWQKLDFEFSLQNDVFNQPDNLLSIYPWNTGKAAIYIDDFKVEFVQGS